MPFNDLMACMQKEMHHGTDSCVPEWFAACTVQRSPCPDPLHLHFETRGQLLPQPWILDVLATKPHQDLLQMKVAGFPRQTQAKGLGCLQKGGVWLTIMLPIPH